MTLPVDVTVENCSATAASRGLVPLDFAVQWQDLPAQDWAIAATQSGEVATVDPLSSCVLDLGAKGQFAAWLGSMATQTTRRVHCPGVPLGVAERVTGSLVSGSIASDTFSSPGDGLALLASAVPTVEFGATVLTNQRTQVRDFNVLREVQELDGRNATFGVYYRWRLTFWPHTGRVGWSLLLNFSDERLSDRTLAWPRVRIRVPIAWLLHVENSARCPTSASYVAGAYRYFDIIAPHTIHDAQSAHFRGTFFVGATNTDDHSEWATMPGNRFNVPRVICDPEEFRGKLFFYEGLPARPDNLSTSACRDRYNAFASHMASRSVGPNDYTREVRDMELHNRSREAGGQPDFAAGPFYECFIKDGGNPLRLPELDAATERHFARPITQRRRGLDEVDARAARIVRWGDYARESFVLDNEYIFLTIIPEDPDVRGKSTSGANREFPFYQGMTGLNRSHWSYNFAIEAVMLTGCFDAEDILRQHVELWLYQWIARADYYHAKASQLRFARSLDMMSWTWFCFGDARIPDRVAEIRAISDSVFDEYAQHVTFGHPFKSWGRTEANDVTDLGGGDVRTMRGTVHDSWQVFMGQGYYRAWQMSGDAFWLTLVRDITEAWITYYRFGSYRYNRRNEWLTTPPLWHTFFKLIYPGANGNPGTYGSFAPASWFTPANEFILWRAFEDNDWAPQMLAIAMRVHASNRALRDKALSIFAQEFTAWRARTNVTLDEVHGKHFGDDALLPSPGFDIIAVADRRRTREPAATVELGEDIVILATPDRRAVLETIFDPIEFGALELAAAVERREVREPDAAFEFGVDFEHLAVAERRSTSEPAASVDMQLELGPFDPETLEVSEPDATFFGSESLVALAETRRVSEPVAIYDDSAGDRAAARIAVRSGNPIVVADTGAAIIRGEATQ